MAKLVLVLHGPNLGRLGQREPEIYGTSTLAEVNSTLQDQAADLGLELRCFQSNAEHALLECIHAAAGEASFIIINPGALTHTSVALRDALLDAGLPFIEVHISNPYAREPFRHHSYLRDAATGVICGLGVQGYELALQAAAGQLRATH